MVIQKRVLALIAAYILGWSLGCAGVARSGRSNVGTPLVLATAPVDDQDSSEKQDQLSYFKNPNPKHKKGEHYAHLFILKNSYLQYYLNQLSLSKPSTSVTEHTHPRAVLIPFFWFPAVVIRF